MWKNSGRATKAGGGDADCSLTMADLLIPFNVTTTPFNFISSGYGQRYIRFQVR